MSKTDQKFYFFSEKLLADDVKIVSWCPTADLILLISLTNSLSLYRNGTTLIWTLEDQIGPEIIIVTWKPNGKEFVLGCDNGQVFKVDITYHTPIITNYWVNPIQPSSITSLNWINYEFKKKQIDIEGFDPNAFDIDSSLPTLSEDPPIEPLIRGLRPKTTKSPLPTKPIENTEIQTLLFVGNKNGQLHVFLNGIYPIGDIDVKKDDIDVSIINISVAYNASSLQILAKSMKIDNEYILYFLDTEILERRKEEIFTISRVQTQLNYLLQYIKVTVDFLKRYHGSYTKSTKNIVEEALYYITTHQEHATAMPEIELIGTLATGNMTAPLQKLFSEYLDSKRIKEWETNVNDGFKNSQRVLCEHILPACERIQLELSKLLGYSLWSQRYADFLEVKKMEECIDCTQKLIIELHQFSKSLGLLIRCFSAFISWITTVSQKVYDSNSAEAEGQSVLCGEPDLVTKYLTMDFTKDSLAEYFNSFTDDKVPNKNLNQLFSNLAKSCSDMLEKPSKTLSTKIHTVSIHPFQLNGVYLYKQPRSNIVTFNKMIKGEESVIYAFLKSEPDLKLMLLRKTFGKSRLQYALLDIKGRITDLEFFDEKELGMLVQTDEENSTLDTILLDNIDFKNLTAESQASIELKPWRSEELNNTINAKIGCNGHPKRRILCVVASNGLLKVYLMDNEQAETDEG